MNVLVVTQYFHPESFLINAVCEDLTELGHKVTVLTGMPNYPGGRLLPGYRLPTTRRERYGRIDVVRVPIIPRGQSAWQLVLNYASFALSATLLGPWLLPKRTDAILVYQPSPLTVGIPAVAIRRLTKAPMIFWVQDLWPESLAATGVSYSPTLLRAVRRLARFIYSRCDIILAQSRGLVERIKQAAPPGADVRYFPNFSERVDEAECGLAAPAEPVRLPSGFRVVCAGNMGVAQDLGVVLDAAERLREIRDLHWVLIGRGRMRAWVEAQIDERNLRSTVHVIGPYPKEQMPGFFREADALLATLRKDELFAITVPSRIQSYLAAGRPIVAAIDGEGGMIVEESGAGIGCPAGDPARLAKAVERLYRASPGERDAMGRAAQAYFEREFDREVLMRRLDEWLSEIMSIESSK